MYDYLAKVILLGPSGAGKSVSTVSLLLLLSSRANPCAGGR